MDNSKNVGGCFRNYIMHHQHISDRHLWEAMAGSGRHPFLIEVVVDHHRGTSRSYALLWTLVTEKEQI